MSAICRVLFSFWYDFDTALETIVRLAKAMHYLIPEATNCLYKLLMKHNITYMRKKYWNFPINKRK